jgi:uncharacterized membrane protein YsdA (DUF1294 family)
MENAILIYLAGANLTAFLLFGWDKWRAKRGGRRTPEKTLLLTAFLAGALGAWLGVKAFRHKTRKPSFLWKLAFATAGNALWVWLYITLFATG